MFWDGFFEELFDFDGDGKSDGFGSAEEFADTMYYMDEEEDFARESDLLEKEFFEEYDKFEDDEYEDV